MNKSVLYKIFVLALTLIACITFTTNIVLANDVAGLVQNMETQANATDTAKIQSISQNIIGALRGIAVAVGIVMLVVMGIKYVSSTTGDAKAEVKKEAVPYVIAVILLFGASAILTVYLNIANSMYD